MSRNHAAPQLRIAEVPRATKWQFCWLCGLILSFAYERSLVYLTPYDRINPRLFDVIFVIGLIIVLRTPRRVTYLPKAFHIWKFLVLWFLICAVVWALFLLPFEYAQFSILFAGQYLIGLAVVYWVLKMSLNGNQKTTLMMLSVFGGVFVSAYCIPEYLAGKTVLQVTEEKSVILTEGTLLGPFGASYFHLAQYQALSFCLAFALSAMARRIFSRIGWGAVALFISWPLFISGSRTGLLLIFLSWIGLFVIESRLRKTLVMALSVLLIFLPFIDAHSILDTFLSGQTAHRIQGFSEGENSAEERFSALLYFDTSRYKWNGAIVPFIGAGFYVAPIYEDSIVEYRVGYGLHNIYLFVFEQAGLIGLILFLTFLAYALKGLFRIRASTSEVDALLACALTVFLVAEMASGVFGQVFWRGFGTSNFNTYLILILMLALTPTECPLRGEKLTT